MERGERQIAVAAATGVVVAVDAAFAGGVVATVALGPAGAIVEMAGIGALIRGGGR